MTCVDPDRVSDFLLDYTEGQLFTVADPEQLFFTQAFDGPDVDDKLVALGAEPEEIRQRVGFRLLRGRWTGLRRFLPEPHGDTVVLAVPVPGDIVVFDEDGDFGRVTGEGLLLGEISEETRVHTSTWRWLIWGGEGVFVLDQRGFPHLASETLIAEGPGHGPTARSRVALQGADHGSDRGRRGTVLDRHLHAGNIERNRSRPTARR